MTAPAGISTFSEFTANSADPEDWADPNRFPELEAHRSAWDSHCGAILAAATRRGGNLLASEQREYDTAEAELSRFADLYDKALRHRAGLFSARNRQMIHTGGGGIRGSVNPIAEDTTVVLRREQRMADYATARGLVPDEHDGLEFRKWVRGIATGDWKDADAERRAMSEGTLSAGGYMVPTPLAARIIDLARNKARVMQAGAQTVPMEYATLKIARVAGDMTAAWHTENALIAASDQTLESVTLTAHTLAANVEASRELIEDTDVGPELENAFAQQMALALDKAALYGSGTAPEPRGVKSSTGITTQLMATNGAAPTNFDPWVDALGTLWDNNFGDDEPEGRSTGIINAPRTERELAKLKDSQGRYLDPPEVLRSVPRYQTNQIPTNLTVGTGTTTSDSFVADWDELLIGIRTSFQIQTLTERFADYGQLGFIAWLRADVVVARPKAFVVVTGIL